MDYKKQEAAIEESMTAKDEELFQSLGISKKKKHRKIFRTVVSIVLILTITIVIGVVVLQRRVREQFAMFDVDVQSYEVKTGTISTVVSGSGTLQNVDMETVTFPADVELTEILVSYGDEVETGDLIATVDIGTVRSAMAEVQATIEDLDEQLSDAENDKVSTYVKAGVSGRVKILYADQGTSVTDAMVKHGAIAVISLDGFMAVDLETDLLHAGDNVLVIRENGDEITGTVEYAAGTKATVLVADDGPRYDEPVTVYTEDGTLISSGKLYIHNPLSVTGYAGTVSRVNTTENRKVYASSVLYTLTDTQTRANYDTLLRQRQDAEETLVELLTIQRNGGITAPISGSIYSVSDLDTEELTEACTISPDLSMSVTITVDETDILSLSVGQKVDVTVSSIGDDTLSGILTELDKTGASGSYTAVVTIDKAEGMLPGMTASADVRIEGVDNAIIIPSDALNLTSTGAYVYTTYDEENQQYGGRIDVVTGLSNSNYVEIKSGLSVGDTVYYTQKQTFSNMFGNRGSMGGGNSGFGSGEMPMSGGSGPNFSGDRSNRGNRPQPNGG